MKMDWYVHFHFCILIGTVHEDVCLVVTAMVMSPIGKSRDECVLWLIIARFSSAPCPLP